MYTKTTFAIDDIEYTRLYLAGLPYYSKFDIQYIQTLDSVLVDLVNHNAESTCIETISTDEAIDAYVEIWDKTIYYRFFFLYRNSRYQLYIVRPYRMDIHNGAVMQRLPPCKILYKSDFSTIEMSLNTKWMNFYTASILDELALKEELEEFKVSLKYNLSTTLITPESMYIAAVQEAQLLSERINTLKPKEVKDTLLKYGFWGYIKGKVCWESNMSPQKASLPSMYKAFAENKGIPAAELVEYIKTQSPKDFPICQKALRLATEQYGNVSFIALDWKKRG